MATHRLVVFSNAVPGKDAEFNDWYDKVQIRPFVRFFWALGATVLWTALTGACTALGCS